MTMTMTMTAKATATMTTTMTMKMSMTMTTPEDCEEDIVLGGDSKLCGQVRARLPNIGGLGQGGG